MLIIEIIYEFMKIYNFLIETCGVWYNRKF